MLSLFLNPNQRCIANKALLTFLIFGIKQNIVQLQMLCSLSFGLLQSCPSHKEEQELLLQSSSLAFSSTASSSAIRA